MFFSVVIPLYNKEAYILHTLQSVLAQTFTDFEVIIVDDGSTDNGLDRLKAISDSRVIIVKKKNEGVSSARNAGISLAKGNFIAFIDADDRWDKEYLHKMHDVIVSNSSENVFACCNAQVGKSGKQKANPLKNLLPDGISVIDYDQLFLRTLESPIHTSALIINKNLFRDYRFNNNVRVGQDLLLWLTISANHKVVMLNETLSFYDRTDSGAATARMMPIGKTFIPYLADMLEFENSSVRKQLITRLILNRIKRYFVFHNDEQVKDCLDKCDFSDATPLQRLFYSSPKWMCRLAYRLVKDLPYAYSADK